MPSAPPTIAIVAAEVVRVAVRPPDGVHDEQADAGQDEDDPMRVATLTLVLLVGRAAEVPSSLPAVAYRVPTGGR